MDEMVNGNNNDRVYDDEQRALNEEAIAEFEAEIANLNINPLVIEEVLDRIRELDAIHGRKLRHCLSIKKQHLEDTPLDVILESHRGIMQVGWAADWTLDQLDRMVEQFEKVQEYINLFDQSEAWDDWNAWHKSILGRCLDLYEMYPCHFGRMLDDFLTPIDARIIFEYSGTEDLRNFRRGGEEASQSILFQSWLKVIYEYKSSYVCSYLFQVIEPWLITTEKVLNDALFHINPIYSDVKCSIGRRRPRKNMDFLHKPEFHEIRDFLNVKTEIPALNEPLIPEGDPDYYTKREEIKRKRMNLDDSEPQKNKTLDIPTSVEPSFQITRSFPSKGGFSNMIVDSEEPKMVYD